MKKIILLCALMPSLAMAQKMQDMSMTPKETMKIISQGNPDLRPLTAAPALGGTTSSYLSNMPKTTGESFMAGYCNPANKPIAQLNGRAGAIQECSNRSREKACDLYSRLPVDAQQAVSNLVECKFDAQGRDCGMYDTARMALVRSYWQNPTVAETIVFLPDEITHPNVDCR